MKFSLHEFKVLDSTNDKAKEIIKKEDNFVVLAYTQKKGKGRFGRKWFSSKGGLYFTICLNAEDVENVKYLTFISSIAVAKVLGKEAKVKWPNDVFFNDKKICGILTETVLGGSNNTLIGIGVNVNQKKFSSKIVHEPTSLFLETKKTSDVKKLYKEIMKNFLVLYSDYENKNYSRILTEWKQLSHTLGKKVKIETVNGTFFGKAVSVDKDCNLVIKLRNGKLKKIMEGDVFVT
ncbi:biotin--[acetyl-CoA-carboxylase] ligase [Candidatus Woesearchaeota archaeon]|nr:biotin--[acetyl-CoA-carboxylase] ligase [Candidatus Woesearchaeota archaeon]